MIKLEDFYREEKDVLGEPQIIEGVPFYPIKLFDIDSTNMLHLFFAKDKLEFVNKKKMPFDGIKLIYKKSFLLSMIYGYCYDDISKYYAVLQMLRDFFTTICDVKTDNDNGDGVVILCNTNITNPLEVFSNDIYIIIKSHNNIIKIDAEMFDVIRECILKQNGISLKSLAGYNADMEEIKKQKLASSKSVSFSDEIFFFIAMSGMDIYNDNLRNYTIYQFKYHFSSLQQLIDYKTLYPIQASGQVKFQDKIKYYLEPLNMEKGRYDDLLISSDEFAQSGIAKSVDSFKIPD